MTTINRRKFLQLTGVGAAVAVAGVAGAGALINNAKGNSFTFKAVSGLPDSALLPVYCAYAIEGTIDLAAHSGTVTEAMFAGAPYEVNTFGTQWPGFGRSVRVSDVKQSGSTITMTGTVTDRSQLRAGESPSFQLRVDRKRGTAQGSFLGVPITLTVR